MSRKPWSCRSWQVMAGHDMSLADHDRSWQVMAGHDMSWQVMADNGLHCSASHTHPCHHVYMSRPHTTYKPYTPAQCILSTGHCHARPCRRPRVVQIPATNHASHEDWIQADLGSFSPALWFISWLLVFSLYFCFMQASSPSDSYSSLSGSCLMRSWRRVLSSRYLFSAAPSDLLLQLRQECRGGQPASEDVSK